MPKRKAESTLPARAKSRAVAKPSDFDMLEEMAREMDANHPACSYIKIDKDTGALLAGDDVLKTPLRVVTDPATAERGFVLKDDGMPIDARWDGHRISEAPEPLSEAWSSAVKIYVYDPIRKVRYIYSTAAKTVVPVVERAIRAALRDLEHRPVDGYAVLEFGPPERQMNSRGHRLHVPVIHFVGWCDPEMLGVDPMKALYPDVRAEDFDDEIPDNGRRKSARE